MLPTRVSAALRFVPRVVSPRADNGMRRSVGENGLLFPVATAKMRA